MEEGKGLLTRGLCCAFFDRHQGGQSLPDSPYARSLRLPTTLSIPQSHLQVTGSVSSWNSEGNSEFGGRAKQVIARPCMIDLYPRKPVMHPYPHS